MPVNASNMPLLLPAGLFACPRCGTSAAVPTAQLIATGSLSNPLAGRCNRCEHSYQFTVGAPSTTTTGTNAQGATTLNVASGTSFTSQSWVVIDSSSVDGGAEIVKASGPGTSTTIPISPLRLTHSAGATVATGTMAPLGSLT